MVLNIIIKDSKISNMKAVSSISCSHQEAMSSVLQPCNQGIKSKLYYR